MWLQQAAEEDPRGTSGWEGPAKVLGTGPGVQDTAPLQ